MTPAIDALYAYLIAYNSVYGRLPTQKQIAADLGKDRSVIGKQMLKLAEQGKIKAHYDVVTYRLKE